MELLEILKKIVEFGGMVCMFALIVIMFMSVVLHMQNRDIKRRFANMNSKKGR